MTPYEALYGCKCQTPLCWMELSESKLIGIYLVHEIEDKIKIIRDHLKAT